MSETETSPQTTETAESAISEFVREYIEPIPGDSPTGSDVSNEEEFFKLNMEIPKTSPDYKKCIELADIILKEKSKDIKVASWLCFALFRTEKIKGLLDGLDLLYNLLIKFGNDLHPANPQHRSKAIQYINSSRFYKLVEREQINSTNAKNIITIEKILSQIVNESGKLFPENPPVLKQIVAVINSHCSTAKKFTAPSEVQQKPAEKKPVESESFSAENKAQTIQTKQTIVSERTESVQQTQKTTKIVSEKDGLVQLRQILLLFFEGEDNGVKKDKLPESIQIFGISRQIQWGRIIRPVETNMVTQLEPPNQVIQGKLKEWFASSNWDTLIPRIEINFLKGDSVFPYWLDSQRIVVKALEQKGGIYTQSAEDIKIQLARLLQRIPDFPQLKFKDKQTPFADDDTTKWINDEVMPSLTKGKGKNEETILPPIMGEEYKSINEEYELAISELPGKLEENLTLMQTAIDTDTRRKGKFLRRLNLANYCIHAKQFSLAKVNLLELKDLIEDYKLANWEPALCTAVWQSLYLTNKKILQERIDEDSKMNIEKEQKELFSKIAKYDGILAIKLSKKSKK
jgi:type VI secretion system protein VasJ